MFLSVFDLFKIGIGPSSSHTMGPMVAAARFLDLLRDRPFSARSLGARLHGSLAFTGKGHATDRAVILGLAGFRPDDYDAEAAEAALDRVARDKAGSPRGWAGSASTPRPTCASTTTRRFPATPTGWPSPPTTPRATPSCARSTIPSAAVSW